MRTYSLNHSFVLALIALAFAESLAIGQSNINFLPIGPATWNSDLNWAPPVNGFRPEATFNEIGVIGTGQTAFVEDTPPSPGGIIVDSGTLEIRSPGILTAIPGPSNTSTGSLAANGTGTLIVKRGGTLDVRGMTTANTSLVTLGESGGVGTASLLVTSGTLNGRTNVIGPNVNFASSGGLYFGSTSVLQPTITSSSHSTITASGTVLAAGVVRPEFSNYVPVLNDSWDLATGASLVGKFSLDKSLAPVLPRGTDFVLKNTGTTATLEYINTLILQVNRGSGAATLLNVVGSPITFDAYTIASADGVLSTSGWSPLQGSGTWEEADNVSSFRLSEFNPTDSSTINVGASLVLGNPFAPPAPAAFGDAVGEDLSFQYSVPIAGPNSAKTVNGTVEYVGGRNNLVLTIDPTTGQAAIQNESPFFDVAIDGYSISSVDGRLKFSNGQWSSLDDQNLSTWEEADNVSSTRVTEFNPSGQTAMDGGGTILNLGSLVDISGNPLRAQDFTFEFSLVGGGQVEGDYNNDGAVNAADYALWRDHRGSAISLPNDPSTGVGDDDYTRWKQYFGNSGGSGPGGILQGIVSIGALPTLGLGSSAPVPEPSSLCGVISLLMTAGFIAQVRQFQRRKS